MNYEQFTPEENEIVSTVERFIEERVRPDVMVFERDRIYPQAIVEEMKELGLFGIAVPEEFGGLGLRVPVFAAVMEIVARGWTTLAAYINSHSTVAYAIASHGTGEQKEKYLPGLATGDFRGSLCLTEPGCGSDLQAIRANAVDRGGAYDLTASKTYVTNGDKATLLLTLVKHPRESPEAKQKFSLLLVDKAAAGVTVTTTFHKMAFGLVDTVQIEMDNVAVPKANLLGAAEGKGFHQLFGSLEIGRIGIAISAVGLAANSLSEAKRYASERVTFGVTIDKHQAIQFKLADMATKLVTARLITMEAAWMKERGGRCDMISAMAKMYASDAAVEIVHDAVKVHGGAGYIQEYAVERLYREALLYTIGEGTNDINRIVISRRINGDEEQTYLGLVP
ncbi:acyl-CoA dehydrogenase family protein [Rhizobium sp. NZLR11]|uniref:acyl-CoA dehydrogenase family protein n=1 Tax=Rhizobium sp. NZLR11 TaxID=2731098 RepID=UPI001C82ABF0|nr:acyl-CoA dehydrogenase family protein [Rhizobium sp. NZLR11]MBX5210488.1 acyl-CoA dehydrogenase [Rhizobium sp. NZLR11]